MSIEWKEINPSYIVSSDGRVGSRKSGRLRMLNPSLTNSGYFVVSLWEGGSHTTGLVHCLVAEAFLGPRPTPEHQPNHKNGIKTDNRDSNLEWVTPSQNTHHAYGILGHKAARGAATYRAKLTEKKVREIRARWSAGETARSIALGSGVGERAIHKAATGKTWGWLS